jgi:hypothetical protein
MEAMLGIDRREHAHESSDTFCYLDFGEICGVGRGSVVQI